MAFQMRMPIPLEERADDKKNITSPTGLFGMNDLMKDTWDKFDNIIDNLLNFQTSSEGQLLYNTDFDMAAIHQKILENVDHGCLADAPNIVILETGGIPNSDEGIFQSTEIGANNILRIWYLYYKWASIFKAHRVGIRVGNYKLQKNALACFAGLFTSAGKSNYSSSVTQYLGMLAQYPKLEEKLECVSSVKIDNDEKRKGHYFAFDEALETFGVKFIKQNITGNVVDDNKLKLQVKAAQSERDRIGILLSEYLNDPCESIGQRAVDTCKTAMWKLVNELLSAFEHSDDYNCYENPLWSTTTPDQITVDSIRRLENCFPNGILRIEEIFLQDVISIQKSNKVGRRKLGITR
ncbi:unnamed protein product [Rhizophagus irregularis]|nr:unnamed protein product [Rhizophagus irregularis]